MSIVDKLSFLSGAFILPGIGIPKLVTFITEGNQYLPMKSIYHGLGATFPACTRLDISKL